MSGLLTAQDFRAWLEGQPADEALLRAETECACSGCVLRRFADEAGQELDWSGWAEEFHLTASPDLPVSAGDDLTAARALELLETPR